LLENIVDECKSLTIGIHPQKKHKKEGTFVSKFPFTTINPVTGTVICAAYKCRHLDKSTDCKHKQNILLNALPQSLIFFVFTIFINETKQPIPRVLKIKAEYLTWLIVVPIKFLESNCETRN
jgi:hypothetical protein